MRFLRRFLDLDIPRSVLTLQVGGLMNAFGNGVVIPFLLIYLHNVRGMSLGTSGLIVAANAFVSLVGGPLSGPVVDRFGGKRVLAFSLVVFAAGFGGLIGVHEAWHGFLAMTLAGIGNSCFWTAQSTLIAGLTTSAQRPSAFGMQRVVMNLGVGLGAVVGGLIATTERPGSFTVIFLIDAATFLLYLAVVLRFIPDLDLGGRARRAEAGEERYRRVLRNRAFLGVAGLNALFIFAGMSGFELLPVFAKNEASVSERQIGLIFLVNTVVIVFAQLPITRASAGRRRMGLMVALGVLWAACWVGVAVAGASLTDSTAMVVFATLMAAFAIGECLHGAVYAPLVSDLAEPELMGRYMALSSVSWQAGFALGPAIGGFLLEATPTGTWVVWAVLCLAGSGLAVLLDRALPGTLRRGPTAAAA